MLQTFQVKNFRCFRDFTLGPLDRVNLIAGRNNTGKTALLEALFLFSSPNNPLLPLQLNSLRGVPQVEAEAAEMGGWLFFGKNIDETIELIGETVDGGRGTLKIRLEQRTQGTTPAPPVATGAPIASGMASPAPSFLIGTNLPRDLVLEYEDSTGQRGLSRRSAPSPFGGALLSIAPLTGIAMTLFLHTHARSPQEDAARFSKLEETGREEEATRHVRILEPRLKRLAVLISAGVPMIHGDLGLGRMVPIPHMGEGVVRLLSLLLAISSAAGGMVLLDEIENGLHHSVLRRVWQAIGAAARDANVQVFATTHSYECIQAAHQAFREGDTYDLRLFRLDRVDDEIRVAVYNRDTLDTSIDMSLEVR
jgi:hypothetical protein